MNENREGASPANQGKALVDEPYLILTKCPDFDGRIKREFLLTGSNLQTIRRQEVRQDSRILDLPGGMGIIAEVPGIGRLLYVQRPEGVMRTILPQS